jgi:hypothetical protein
MFRHEIFGVFTTDSTGYNRIGCKPKGLVRLALEGFTTVTTDFFYKTLEIRELKN